ncbi:MAG: SpaH/EbpB family LPXTG-anchored major pilin, partial [Eubacterium limosum]|nr:SpaH/EbpB family LPXTG-anchored major pilin [Eubacterium limosum]
SGSVKVTGDKSGELTKDYHYEVIEPSAGNNNTMTVKLKKEGMEQLANGDGAGQDSVLSVEFRSSMADDYDHNTSIHNNALVFYSFEGDPDNPDPPTEPADKPFIFDGMVGFMKVAADEVEAVPAASTNKKPLEGAYFQIATSEANALNGNYITRNGNVVREQSDASGVVRFKGLELTPEFDVSGNFTGFVQDSFWAVEVQAPDGYNLIDGPVKITIDASAFGNKTDDQGRPIPNTVELKDGKEFANVELTVVNTPSNSRLVLPKTGGMGTLMFTAGGIALIGVAVVLLVVYRKKTRQN